MKRLYRRSFIWLRLTAEYSVVFVLMIVWLFSGKPQFNFGILFPPSVQEAGAAAESLLPSAAGTYQEWDVSGAASHWQALSDLSSSSYVSTGVDEERDTEAMGNMNLSSTFIQQVDVIMTCYAPGGGGAGEKAATFIREGGTDTEGTAETLDRSSFTPYTTTYTTNPRTSAAWTVTSVNALEAGVRLKTIGSGESVRCSEIEVQQTPSSAKMSAYRWFTNANSTDVGAALANQDTAYTLTSDGQAFRLRLLMHVATAQLNQNSEPMTLQFAEKSGTCDTAYSGESWSDVTAATVIAYNNNATPTDGSALTVNANDPSDGHTKVTQRYEELNDFQNSAAAIPSGQDGIWDFSLKDNGATDGVTYCFRVIKSDDNVPTTSSLSELPNITIYAADVTAPTITNVSSDKANGTYTTGEVIDIDVTFSEAVTSTGNVTVELETGDTDRTCTFTVSSATTGTCDYTVQAGDTTSDLTVKTISGTIKDAALNSMTDFVPATNLAANKAIVIDTTAPTITNVSSDHANGTYTTGEVIDIDVTFSEAVTSTGNVTVELETGTTDRTCTFTVSAATSGTCDYTVQAGDESSDLTVKTISGTIKDAALNSMTNFVPATNLTPNKAIVIDAVAPTSAGNLTFLNRGTSTISLLFGSEGSDTNAPGSNAYKLYYKQGTSGVATSDTEKDSTDFDRYDYGEGDDGNDFNAITLTGLSPGTNYVFNIWTYDAASNSSSATEYTTTTESYPAGSFNSASQKTNGSGIVDISTEADDADDFDTRLKIDYQATSACNAWSDPTLQTPLTADFNDSGGAPDVNNASTYQVGSGTNTRVITSSGSNTVQFDWDSNTDQSAGDATMCLRLTVNDSHSTTLDLTNAVDNQITGTGGADATWNRGSYENTAAGRGASSSILQRALLKFDLSAIPAGATIDSATLTLTCTGQSSTGSNTINAYKLLRAWSEGKESTYVLNADSSWNYSDYSTAWGTAGADNTTNDRSSSSMGSVAIGDACANQTHTISLDTATVSGWINAPVTNLGFILIGDESTNDSSKIFGSAENSTASYRPKLTIAYTTDSDQSSPATQTLTVDNVNPATPGSMTFNSKTDVSVTLNLGADSSDTNDPGTNNYRLFYKVGADAPAETDTEFDSVAFDSWDPGATIAVTGLSAGTQYTFNIWAYDTYCQTSIASCTKNKAAAATPVTVTTSAKPTGLINSATQLTDGSGIVAISNEIDDANDDDTKFKLEYDADSSCDGAWLDPTLVTASSTADFNDSGGEPSVVNGDTYQVGTTATQRVITSSGSNTVLVDWQSATDQATGNATMCVRLTANDDTDDQTTPDTQTVVIDNVDPVVGDLADGGKTDTTVTLTFPVPATETNFDRYRIFYKQGASGVAETDTEQSDDDLLAQNFNSTVNTTVMGLTASTQYVFNIWAYDDYCTTNYASCSNNKASGSEITVTTQGAGDYTAIGSLISSSIDTQDYATIANNNLLRVKWTQNVPSDCVLDLYFRGTNAGTEGTPDYTGILWTHATTTATTTPGYYAPTTRNEDLSDETSLQGKRWFQYLIDMHSCNSQNSTPEFTGVWLEFD